ncbi:hypothetical protein BJX76DRAFT_145939 [Aspergillus varians]
MYRAWAFCWLMWLISFHALYLYLLCSVPPPSVSLHFSHTHKNWKGKERKRKRKGKRTHLNLVEARLSRLLIPRPLEVRIQLRNTEFTG